MTAPPAMPATVRPVDPPDMNAVSRELLAEGERIVEAHRLPFNRREVRRIVARFIESGANVDDLLAYVLDYADPTGEQAAANVDRSRSAR